METNCLICDRIALIHENKNPDFVAELETGYVVIGWHQFFRGYTIFFCKEHKTELHELQPEFKLQFLKEMSEVSEAVFKAFKPRKLNYEMLGNSDAHMHWHLFPRHVDDSNPNGPVWEVDPAISRSDATKLSPEELEIFKQRLLEQLQSTTTIVRAYTQ